MRALVVFVSLLALALAGGCSSPDTDTIGTSRSAIVGGSDSGASQDAVVFLVHDDPTTGRIGMCTGTLVASNLVLTARHCVADADASADCAADGSAIHGGRVRADVEPPTILVYTGKDRPPFKTRRIPPPAAIGATIVDDGSKDLCDHDIAFVVLASPIANARVAPLRLDRDVARGETFTAVGWGITTTSTTPPVRQQREGVTIVAIGPDASRDLPVPPHQFAASEGPCLGDSGGPAFDAGGAIVGVLSGGGNGRTSTPDDPTASCVGGASNLYTRLAPFADLVAHAFDVAGGDPTHAPATSEGETAPEATTRSPSSSGGCTSAARGRGADGHAIVLAVFVVAALGARRRMRACPARTSGTRPPSSTRSSRAPRAKAR